MDLQHVPGGRLFGAYATSFERVWDSARPVTIATYAGIKARGEA